MDGPRSPASPPPERPKRGLGRVDSDTPAAIAAWEQEIVERAHRDFQERRSRQGSSGGVSNSSNASISWADRPSPSPRSPTSPGSVSRRGYIQDPVTSNASILNCNVSPRSGTSESVKPRRSESINSIGQASIASSPRSPGASSGFIDYSGKRRSSLIIDGSGGSGSVGGGVAGAASFIEEPATISLSPSSSSSTKPSFLEEYGLELEGSSPASSSNRGASRFKGFRKDSSRSGALSPPIPSPLSPNASTLSISNPIQLSSKAPLPPTPDNPIQAARGLSTDIPFHPSQVPSTPPTVPPRPRLDSDASFYPSEKMSNSRGSRVFSNDAKSQDSHCYSTHATSSISNLAEESLSSHSSSEAKVRGAALSVPQTEVDMVRSALARSASGSQEFDYSDLVATSESDHTRESQPSSSSNLPPTLPPRSFPPVSSTSSATSSPNLDRGVSTGVEPSQGPPALPRRPNGASTSSASLNNSILSSPQVETKAEKKAREASEKIDAKQEKTRLKEEAASEKQRAKDEAARVKEEIIIKKKNEQDEAKKEKERAKWRKEKKKNEEIERSILEASVEELEIAQFLNNFGKHVHEVKAVAPLDPDEAVEVEWPSRADWMSGGGGFLANVGYSAAVLTALACYLSPRGPTQITLPEAKTASRTGVEIQDEDNDDPEFSLDALKSNGERLYLTALPMYEGFFGSLNSLGRWERPITTLISFLIYSVLWWNGLLLPGFFATLIFYTLKLKASPPKPDALRKIMALRQKRNDELANFAAGLQDDSGKEMMKEAEHEKAAPNSESAPSEAEAEVEPLTPTSVKPEILKKDKIKKQAKKSSKYGLAADATRKYGTVATFHTSNLADVHERIKNFFLWKSPAATTRAVCWLSILMAATLLLSPRILIRIPGLALGISFFFVLPIAQRKPHWLPVMANPIELLLAGIPNDAQVAIQLMRKRALLGKPLIGDQRLLVNPQFLKSNEMAFKTIEGEEATNEEIDIMLSGANGNGGATGSNGKVDWNKWRNKIEQGRNFAIKGSEIISGQRGITLPRISNDQSSSSGQQGLSTFLTNSVNYGLGYAENQQVKRLGGSNPGRLEEKDLIQADGIYWAIYNSTSGHLVVSADRIIFRSTFAKKLEDGKDGTEDKNGGQKVRDLFEISLDSISNLRKTKSVNLVVWSTDGLNIQIKKGETLVLSNMLKRDEAFNRILALSPFHWSKV